MKMPRGNDGLTARAALGDFGRFFGRFFSTSFMSSGSLIINERRKGVRKSPMRVGHNVRAAPTVSPGETNANRAAKKRDPRVPPTLAGSCQGGGKARGDHIDPAWGCAPPTEPRTKRFRACSDLEIIKVTWAIECEDILKM